MDIKKIAEIAETECINTYGHSAKNIYTTSYKAGFIAAFKYKAIHPDTLGEITINEDQMYDFAGCALTNERELGRIEGVEWALEQLNKEP